MKDRSFSEVHFPRITISGLRGGSGKTILSLALCWLFSRQGFKVKAFKKGPDYIDAKWLALATGNHASNLDPFLFTTHQIRSLFWSKADLFDLALIEGNRGLFDGKDIQGSCSTAELARVLDSPVLLVLDCTKVTRTAAAIVLGCNMFEENLKLSGVILNQTAGDRHRDIARRSIEKYTDVPVLGALPKLSDNPVPERHMGLISYEEIAGRENMLKSLGQVVSDNVDLDRVLSIARSAPPDHEDVIPLSLSSRIDSSGPTIGVIRDSVFWFYYQENLEALRQAGAGIIELSVVSEDDWPEIHGLYLGGGFPEIRAKELEGNRKIKQKVKALAENGLPIYAECGGFMYLAESLDYQDNVFLMSGVFPVRTRVYEKPQGLGYIQAEVVAPNPFYPVGEKIVGHEFHYSRCLSLNQEARFCMRLERGTGMKNSLDGLIYKNVLAGYAHIHALSTSSWALNFVRAASIYKDFVRKKSGSCPDIICP